MDALAIGAFIQLPSRAHTNKAFLFQLRPDSLQYYG